MSALDELIQMLRLVEEHLEKAGVHLVTSRTALAEAEQALVKLDPDHPETVVPPGLHRADDQIERTQGMIEHILDTVRDFVTRL
ncbi:hypothetical protein [Saccharopolyspora phatthalungensis]|uniref:L-lactate utilization protein LutB n=1 Tax=Saccharopolyspora phatthalungensis TaxID=664693 RepID=A0A840Q5V7_9PSEU|nr:hypothetical protein [Saccharopolyspora phatthalungensis]MBB5153765.1 L-lactate utilization protein LutB [Saccharopolyspora phatthalungensis]